MLLNKINENNKDKYDFFYLPIDFKVKINFNSHYFLLTYFCRINAMSAMHLSTSSTQFSSLSFLRSSTERDGSASTVKKFARSRLAVFKGKSP